jgi:heterogeneous nuclear ribonucleoprotein F/H
MQDAEVEKDADVEKAADKGVENGVELKEKDSKRKNAFDDGAEEEIDYDDDEDDDDDAHEYRGCDRHKRPRPEESRGGRDHDSSKTKVAPTAFVRLRGLPWGIKKQQIRDFFDGCEIADAGIHVLYNQGGEGYVHFANMEDGTKAVEFNRKEIGRRYIEVFPSTKVEVDDATKDVQPDGDLECVVHMRGLPYSATVAHISTFFGKVISPSNVHQPLPKGGRPSGDAYVMFGSTEDAMEAMAKDKVGSLLCCSHPRLHASPYTPPGKDGGPVD